MIICVWFFLMIEDKGRWMRDNCALPGFVILLCFVLAGLAGPCVAEVSPEVERALAERLAADRKTVLVCRAGLAAVGEFVASRPDLFAGRKSETPRLLSAAEKAEIRQAWSAALEYVLALDQVAEFHGDFYKLETDDQRADSLLIVYAASMSQLRFALAFAAATQHDPALDTLLNEGVPEDGLKADTYTAFKYRFLHVARFTEFLAFGLLYKQWRNERAPELSRAVAEDEARLRQAARKRAAKLVVKNGLKIIKRKSLSAWMPAQKGISEWMGDVKVHRRHCSLIALGQVEALRPRLEPGDVLLERREWYVSNVGLPGFWSHGALFIGSAPERRAYFDDAEVREWVRGQGVKSGDFEELLRAECAPAYAANEAPVAHGEVARVIEAVSEGVIFSSLEHRAEADSLAVLRPRLSKREKAFAVLRAFRYWGRPYDFDFDFVTDAKLVCTEVIYKAYEPAGAMRGVRWTPRKIMGRVVVTANDMVRQFAHEWAAPEQQLDLVCFLDGHERAGKAVVSDVAELRLSWRRPNWHIFVQDAPAE